MFERDYLMRMLAQFFEALVRSVQKAQDERDPAAAAELLEDAIGVATEIDGATLLSLAPESIASIMQVSGVEPQITEYVARSIQLEAQYLTEAGNDELATLRRAQAAAIAEAYGFALQNIPFSKEELEALCEGKQKSELHK